MKPVTVLGEPALIQHIRPGYHTLVLPRRMASRHAFSGRPESSTHFLQPGSAYKIPHIELYFILIDVSISGVGTVRAFLCAIWTDLLSGKDDGKDES
ncbi:hypothetical protein [Acetobacter persici]|uniref:hypothetical protein n=1 Tax=Acetobacter persici TaxID=1076596 RepID=UPI001AD8138B|nr:hypothetical protein [Acetobacter persici]